jgi:hypothetical protein
MDPSMPGHGDDAIWPDAGFPFHFNGFLSIARELAKTLE